MNMTPDELVAYLRASPTSDASRAAADMIERLQAALAGLEQANEQLCGLRTHEQYLSMIDGGQQEALEGLDAARLHARAALKGESNAESR